MPIDPDPIHGRARRWQLCPGQLLQAYSWDELEFVLFNDLAGDTHLLDKDAIDVLHLLRAAPSDAGELAAKLQLDAEQSGALADLLPALAKLALIEPLAC